MRLTAAVLFLMASSVVKAQTVAADSVVAAVDSLYEQMAVDSLSEKVAVDSVVAAADSSVSQMVASKPLKKMREQRDWSIWRPDPQRALWLAARAMYQPCSP